MQVHPHPIPTETLTGNLASLQGKQPGLHTRLHWPVEDAHLRQGLDGEWMYRVHENEFSAVLTVQEIAGALASIDPAFEATVWLFGVGLGELLVGLLERCPRAQVIAWERDPLLMRRALQLHDFSSDIESGRLQFALNADLPLLLEKGPPETVVLHPFFARIYNNERQLLDAPMDRPRALVCRGTLFVESLADALRTEGYNVFSFDVERQSPEELELVLRSWRAELVAGINYVQGLAEFCEDHGVDYLCWEIDPATDAPRRLQKPAPRARVFTYRQANIAAFEGAGLTHVSYLPLAADPERRRPIALAADRQERYGAPVSFVGASMMRNVETFQQSFCTQLAAWDQSPRDRASHVMAEVLAAQRLDFTRYSIPGTLEAALPGFRQHCASLGTQDPALLLAEISAAEKRLNYLVELAPYNLTVWGDAGWKQLEAHGVHTPGSALHETELPLIYGASTVNVDIGRLYQSDIITMRVFDILACGGFVLAEHSDALADAFELGVEIESYRTLPELKHKLAHFLAHPAEAQAIATRGRAAVLARHTIAGRVREMLAAR